MGPPTKGVHFAEQPLIFQLDLPSSGATMVRTPQVTVMDRQWGELYDDKGPTQRMRRFLEAIAKVIVSQLRHRGPAYDSLIVSDATRG